MKIINILDLYIVIVLIILLGSIMKVIDILDLYIIITLKLILILWY